MDITTKQMLSSALQDLARGLKKLRTVVDRQTFVNSVTNVSEIGNCAPFVSEIGTTIPDDKDLGNSDPVNSFMGHTPSEWLLDPENPWTSFFSTCTFLFGDTLRGDRFKNQWLEDKTTVKGWRKISMEHLSSLHQEAVGYQDCCATIVQYCPRKMDFESDWCVDISDKKWDLREQLWEMDTSKKAFRRWLVSVHSSLPALNLPSVR